MKYSHGCLIRIPFIDTVIDAETGKEATTRNWATLNLRGKDIDRRRIKRTVRQWVWNSLGRRLHDYELRKLCNRKRITALNEKGQFAAL